MKLPVNRIARMKAWTASGDNANAVVTIPAEAGGVNVISKIVWSYKGTPVGRLTVVAGSDTLLDIDITEGGPGWIDFEGPDNPGLHNQESTDEEVVVTLYASGTAGVVGKLNVLAR